MTQRTTMMLAGAFAAALATMVQASPASDAQAIKDYKLTLPVMEKIAKANAIAKQASAKDPGRQRLAKLEDELAKLEAKEEPTEAEHERMAVLADEIARAEDEDQDDDFGGAESLAEFARRVDADPRLGAAIRSVGLTSREYSTALFALLQAGLTAGLLDQKLLQQAPPELSKHNLDFVRQHRAELEALGVMTRDGK